MQIKYQVNLYANNQNIMEILKITIFPWLLQRSDEYELVTKLLAKSYQWTIFHSMNLKAPWNAFF